MQFLVGNMYNPECYYNLMALDDALQFSQHK
jgi:hypothetical protein